MLENYRVLSLGDAIRVDPPDSLDTLVLVARDFQLPPISARRKLGEETEQILRDAIMSGDWAAGSRLRIEDLAKRLGISTMPIREALVSLTNEGLVESLPRRGSQVATVRVQDIEDVYEVHAYIASKLAERASQTMDDQSLTRLHEIQNEIERVAKLRTNARSRAQRIEELNYQFHRVINKSVDAPRLQWFLRTATRYVPRRLYETLPEWVDISLRDHPQIIEALENGSGRDAKQLVHKHVLNGGAMLIAQLRSDEALAAQRQ